MDYVIIVAGGKGLRMGGDIPKQFRKVDGMPILMRTINRFREYSRQLRIILVLPENQQSVWHSLCRKHSFDEDDLLIADGGQTRFHSVRNGLDMIRDDEEGIVGVHDGVRPFVSTQVIRSCYEEAGKHKAVVPTIPVAETLWHTDGFTIDRNKHVLGQTPQTFSIALLKEAYRQPYEESFTDDASVVRSMGHHIMLIKGNPENIKITTPYDLKIAEALV